MHGSHDRGNERAPGALLAKLSRMARRFARAAVVAVGISPIVLAALLVAPNAPAGPPGPWVFIPPPGGTTSTTAKTTTTVAPTTTASATTVKAEDGMESVKKATVVIERNKKPIAIGVLLNEKSFILTARSAVVAGGGGDLEVRFPEQGFTTKAKLVHEDEAWDLAILVPQTTKGAEGAKAAETDPMSTSVTFSTFVLLKTGKLQAQATSVLGRRDFLSPEGDTLKDALSIDTKSLAIGTPLVDDHGGVVAMVGRACAPGSPKATIAGKGVCMPQLFGAPLPIIRKFLKSAPANVKPFSPFLGVVGSTDPLGVKITEVKAGSPAATAGLKAGEDTIVSIDGKVVRTIDELHEQVSKHSVGDVVTLLVAKAGSIREVKATLKSADGSDDSTGGVGGGTGTKSPPTPPTIALPPLPTIPTIVVKPQPKK